MLASVMSGKSAPRAALTAATLSMSRARSKPTLILMPRKPCRARVSAFSTVAAVSSGYSAVA